MSRYVSGFAFVAIGVFIFGSTADGQSNLTAKVRNLRAQPFNTVVESDRIRDGLVGPVRRVRTEIVKLTTQDGRVTEGKRTLLEIVAYDLKGKKIENQYFPITGSTLTGKEVYKYDDKGNISEMTLVDSDGTLLSKESYKYEFDFAGNWNKMITSVGIVDGGRVSFEPMEVTYRSIMYYLDESMFKMVQPSAPNASRSTNSVRTESEAKVATPPQNKTGNQVSSPALPNAVDRVIEMSSTEVKTLAADADSDSQRVVMDSEPPSPAFQPILKPVSGGVLNGTAISLPAPLYPDTAKRMRISGVVSVSVVVDEVGKVIAAEATGGPAPLRSAAMQAALRARFSPTKLSGQPVKVSGLINYKFNLTQ